MPEHHFASTQVWTPLVGAQSSEMAAVLGCGAFPFPILEPWFPSASPSHTPCSLAHLLNSGVKWLSFILESLNSLSCRVIRAAAVSFQGKGK